MRLDLLNLRRDRFLQTARLERLRGSHVRSPGVVGAFGSTNFQSVLQPVCLSRRVALDVPTSVDPTAVGLSIGALRLVINRTLGEADGHFLQRNIAGRAGASAGTNAGNDAVVEYVRIVNQLGAAGLPHIDDDFRNVFAGTALLTQDGRCLVHV